jgi:uncharacterized protein YbbC (DUF1343 family)
MARRRNRRILVDSMRMSRRTVLAGLSLGPAALAIPPEPRTLSPDLDAVVEAAIREDQAPGAVLLVGHQGRVVHRKAYGSRSIEPSREPMTVDTIFDAASLTKVLATVPTLLRLLEQGKVRLNDRVTAYLREFQGGTSDITVRDLATHFSGLRPDLDLVPGWGGYQTGIRLALNDKPANPPGLRFVYSDINFILLGEIVRRVSGRTLADFARDAVFAPLGMRETMFLPPASLRPRIAPTQLVNGRILHGEVHDDTARNMGGVAGHAGVFTTADDLARFAEMMLGKGESNGVRVLSALALDKAVTPQSPPDQPILRGIGWDIDSPYSGPRGELFPVGSYGHTGFTGTSIWIDPASRTYVILLTNSVHPRRRPPINSLRCRVATAVAAALGIEAPGISITGYNETFAGAGLHRVVARNANTLTGLDALAARRFALLERMRVGLITNHTGVDAAGVRGVDRMIQGGVKVAALFSPEHGIGGTEDRLLSDGKDSATGIPVFSLFTGKTLRPSAAMLRGLDALVFDIQDVGARFYTYATTMGYCLEEAAKHRLPFFVLDRPNPITGVHVEGPMLDPDLLSFIGYMSLPVRHGMTAGELARLFNKTNRLGADLQVIAMRNWSRGDWFDSTGIPWVDPSPNMRSLNAALLYPGVGMLEGSKNYSVGRGTDAPFEQIGADWIRGPELAGYLNGRFIPGVRVYPARFRPAASNLAGMLIEGVRFVITDREAFDSGRLGLEIAAALGRLFPRKMAFGDNLRLIGSRKTIAALEAGEDPRLIQQAGQEALGEFLALRREHLLYR